MKLIKIKNRYDDTVIISGKYESIKDCLEKNRDADLRYADLRYADLQGSDLQGSYLRYADLWYANLQGSDLQGSDLQNADLQNANLQNANLRNANLQNAYLQNANLQNANLQNANLWNAYLRNAKNYSEHHSFFQEVIRQQDSKIFKNEQWGIIGQICILKLCWDSIKKRFNKKAMTIFKKLSKVGFNEFELKYKDV